MRRSSLPMIHCRLLTFNSLLKLLSAEMLEQLGLPTEESTVDQLKGH